MCGICVWISKSGGVDPERMARATELMRHRGPDNRTAMLWRAGERHGAKAESCGPGAYHVGLGHARLSILDLSTDANQPMMHPETGAALVYNGEVYNYLELRSQIAGADLRTASDTEVLSEMLARYGLAATRELNGMWAFALYEPERGRVCLSRDRYGKKPLFYYHDEEHFIAASEQRVIFEILGRARKLSPDFLYGFLIGKRWPVFPDGGSLYEGIRSLPGGASLTFDVASHTLELAHDNSIADWLDRPVNVADMGREIEEAVNLRLRSDVPVAVMISGGVDSSVVASYVAKEPENRTNIAFYTIDVNDPDDLRHSRIIAKDLGIELVEVESRIDAETTVEYLKKMMFHYEMPINFGLLALPGYLVNRKMHEDGIRVVLDGTGGDEVFGGYSPYYTSAMENLMLQRRFLRAFRLKVKTEQREEYPSLGRRLSGWWKFARRSVVPKDRPTKAEERGMFLGRTASLASEAELMQIVATAYGRDRLDDVADYQLFDLLYGQMQTYLFSNDQNSMINSIECRSPLMDYRFVKYLRMDEKYKYHRGFNKYQLRRSMHGSVSDAIRWRKGKAGFNLLPKGFFEQWRPAMESAVLASPLLGELFDMKRLLEELKEAERHWRFRSLLQQLYSVTLFEEQFPDVQV